MRQPSPYLKNGFWVTSAGGIPHQKLCEESKGKKFAKLCLARLLVTRADRSRQSILGEPATVSQVYEDFLNVKKAENELQTYLGYRDCLEPFFQKFATRTISSLTYEEGIEYKQWLKTEKEWVKGKVKMKGLGPARVNKCMRVAKMLMSWASKPSRRAKYGITENTWQEIRQEVEQPRERLITPEEFRHLLEQCSDGSVSGGSVDFREQLIVIRYTTMRPQELRKLRWEYVSFETNRIVFPAQHVKTKKRRETTMIDVVKTTLLQRKMRCEAQGIKAEGFVFPQPGRRDGKRVAVEAGAKIQDGHSLSQRFRRLFDRCVEKGLIEKEKIGERICLYNNRHTRITELFVEGNEHHIVMHEAGHVTPQTTQRYKHLAGSFVGEQIRARDTNKETK